MTDKTKPSEGQQALERFIQKLKDQGHNVREMQVTDEEQPLVANFVSGKRLQSDQKPEDKSK